MKLKEKLEMYKEMLNTASTYNT